VLQTLQTTLTKIELLNKQHHLTVDRCDMLLSITAAKSKTWYVLTKHNLLCSKTKIKIMLKKSK